MKLLIIALLFPLAVFAQDKKIDSPKDTFNAAAPTNPAFLMKMKKEQERDSLTKAAKAKQPARKPQKAKSQK